MEELLPLPLDAYTGEAGMTLWQLLVHRAEAEPVNVVATVVFVLAIVHTFLAARITAAAHRLQHRIAKETGGDGHSFRVEMLHFFGEVEAVFGIWAIPLLLAAAVMKGWHSVEGYVAHVHFTEPMFVVVVMAIASTRPVLSFAEKCLGGVASLGGKTPLAWWAAILTVGPLLGSFITEPAAMTICALLLARHLYELDPSPRLKYGTLGLLFVNVSVGGTLTHFAAPPGPDGRGEVRLGPDLHAPELRVEGGARRRRLDGALRLRLPEGVRRPRRAEEGAPGGPGGAPVGAGGARAGSSRPTSSSSAGPSSPPTLRPSSSRASSTSSPSRRRRRLTRTR